LRYCPTSRKVAGSIPDGVIGIFYWYNPSRRTMAQHLSKSSAKNIYWGAKAPGAYGWQPYHLHMLTVLKSGSLNLPEPSGLYRDCFTFYGVEYCSMLLIKGTADGGTVVKVLCYK
jgi:hypothetical protein